MTYIDTAILDVTEWLCRRFQRLTGRTNLWLALQLTNLSIVMYFVWAGLYFWTSKDATVRAGVAVIAAVVLYALTQTLFRDSIEVHESNAFRRVAKGLRNPRRLRDALLRIQFVVLSLVLGGPILLVSATEQFRIVILGYPLILLTTVVLYLMACDPLPPARAPRPGWLGALAGLMGGAGRRQAAGEQ